MLVGFEHGDIHRPYIIGSVWNGKDKPPESVENSVMGGKVRLRTFKTRTGHQIQFVEEDKGVSKAGIYLETAKGHKIRLNDSDRHIYLETLNGHQIKMDDQNQQIEIKTTSGHQIIMSDSNAAIKIQSMGNLSIEAVGTITIKGAMIYIN